MAGRTLFFFPGIIMKIMGEEQYFLPGQLDTL
jgi:hypothetical protein